MVFDSFDFALFLLPVLALYFVLPHRWQNWMLLAASYFFYGYWDWRFLFLLFGSTVVDYFVAKRLEATDDARARKRLVWISVCVNLGALGFFKYFNFFVENMENLLRGLGVQVNPVTLNIILPIGISFYTFQTLTYVIDVYRGKIGACKRFDDFALFVAYFPQLVAGPIERAARLLPQIEKPRRVKPSQFREGAWLIYWGLFKKMYIADNCAHVVDRVYSDLGQATAPEIYIATLAFAAQLYGDFSGYSDIARGTAKLMGINLMLNFNLPFFARNPADFWRRWHISLSECLRDDLYIPLGGSRVPLWKQCRNLIITMTAAGLWHGARWNCVLWGMQEGIKLAIQRWWSARREARGEAAHDLQPRRRAIDALMVLATFHLTLFGFFIFRSQGLDQIGAAFIQWGTNWSWGPNSTADMHTVLAYAWPLLLLQPIQYFRRDLNVIRRFPPWVRLLVFTAMYFLLTIYGAYDARPFIYFQF